MPPEETLRRIHPDPDVMSTEQVRQFMLVAGRKVPKQLDRKAVQAMLDSVRGTPIAYAVHLAILKTMIGRGGRLRTFGTDTDNQAAAKRVRFAINAARDHIFKKAEKSSSTPP